MKAPATNEPGPEVIEYVDVPDPDPGQVDVVVRVEACALNRLDVVQRNGWFALDGFTLPHIAGMDIAGTVVAVGTRWTSRRSVGDRVVVDPSLAGVDDRSKLVRTSATSTASWACSARRSTAATPSCAWSPASHVYRVPDDMPIEHAATFPTCLPDRLPRPVRRRRSCRQARPCMIHAAGSGVSVAAIQLAKRAGRHGAGNRRLAGEARSGDQPGRRSRAQQPHWRHRRCGLAR